MDTPVPLVPPRKLPTESTEKAKRRVRRIEGVRIITNHGPRSEPTRAFLERTDAHVVFAQETKLDGGSLSEAQHWCFRHGRKGFISPCWRSDAGEPVAGVGVFVRKHIGVSAIGGPGEEQQATPGSICQGRTQAVHLDFGMQAD